MEREERIGFQPWVTDDASSVDLWLCGYVPQAAALKSSPAPRVNSFDCSLNRHEITLLKKKWKLIIINNRNLFLLQLIHSLAFFKLVWKYRDVSPTKCISKEYR
jgi:hypothetical protein